MLTGYQVETIAYMTDGDIICRQCALDDYSELTLDKLDRGLSNVADGELSPLCRYTVGEYTSEQASEYASEEFDYDEDPDGWQDAFDRYDILSCGHCGADIR